ncbi:MAG: hypothetical protein H7Y01_10000 [Ferruginibacter sp.]|nr:hypothetical protein [Chitinophagaceae bacterium]
MNTIIRKGMLSAMTALLALQTWGQEKGLDVDIDINKKESNWYQQPWVWIVGGAVFILILVALLRGGGKKE